MTHTKKVLILGRSHHPDGKETADEIYAGLVPYFDEDISIERGYLKNLVFDISNDAISVRSVDTGADLKEYGAVLMTNWFSHASVRKDVAYAIALYLNANGVACFNGEALHSRSTSKLSQMMLAALHDVPIPRTIFSISYQKLSEAIQQEPAIGEPFILKDAQASRGKGNYLLKSYGELADHTAEHTESHPFMVQSFVPSDHSDYRMFVAGGKVAFIIHRLGSENSHLHNTSAGASAELLQTSEVSKEIITQVERMSDILHREVTGIDIIFDKTNNQHYFLEANPIPQIATGSFTNDKLKALADALKNAAHGEKL